MSFHNSLTGTDIHVAVAFTYANAAARTGATVASTDIGKIAVESDTNRYYVLLNNSPVTWSQISGLDQVTSDSSTTGTAATLQAADINYGVVRLTNGSLVSVGNIPAGSAGQALVIQNQTGNGVNVLDNNGATTTSIRTGTGATVEVLPNATVTLLYDATASRWMMVGGSGSGGLSAWQATTVYNQGSVVANGKITYVALESFTSGSTFSSDLFDGYWQQLNLPILGRNYAQTGNNFEDNTTGGWQLFTLPNQYTFTVSALSTSIPVGATFSNNSQIFEVTTAAASGATTLIASSAGAPIASGTLTSTTWTFTCSALANAIPVGATYTNNGSIYTVIQAAAAGATTLVASTTTIAAGQTGLTLTWASGAAPGLTSAPANVTFSAVTTGTTVPTSVTFSSQASAAFTAGSVPFTFPTIGSASSMTVAASSGGISGQYSLLVGNTASTNLTTGQGIISPTYSIDQVDRAKMLQTAISYMASGSNANFMNFSGSSSNTWALYVQDITNNAWIQPQGVYNFTQGTTTLAGKCTGTWQTPSNMVFFRIALLCINNSTASSPGVNTVQTYFDDLYVGPQTAPSGPAVTDYVSFTPTGAFTTNTTYAGVMRRVGDSLQVYETLTFSGAPNSVSILSLNLPPGLTIDTTKQLGTGNTISTVFGTASLNQGGAVAEGLVVYGASSTQIAVTYQNTTTANANITNTAPFTWASGGNITVAYQVPIVGWSSNTSMSSDTDTRVVAMRATGTSTALTGTLANITFTTTIKDTHGAFNGTTYTVPVSGFYRFVLASLFSGTFATNTTNQIQINQNGTLVDRYAFRSGGAVNDQPMQLVSEFYCNSGDAITFQGQSAAGSPAYSSGDTRVQVERISGPAVVAATESVAASYSGTSSVIAAANTWNAVACTTRNYDTHSEYNTSTGAYTVPVSGKYRVTVSSGFTSTSGAVTEGFFVGIGHNSSTSPSAQNGVLATTTSSNTYYCQCSQTIACVTGDTLYGLVQQSMNGSTNLVLQTAAAISYICIERVGN